MKPIAKFFILCFIVTSCNIRQETKIVPEKINFTSFELSYTNGWTRSFSFRVDSNKIYFSPITWDTVYYGIVPDTLFAFIDSTISGNIFRQQSKINPISCYDCSVIGILLVTNRDTIKIRQSGGDIDKSFYELIRQTENLIYQKHDILLTNIAITLETEKLIKQSPPPVKE